MAALTEHDLDQLIYDRSVRLLMLRGGRTLWEAAPSPLHQMVIDEIRTSIRPTAQRSDASGCGCYHLSDVYIRLPDESLVRPDIAIFGEQPPRQRQALTLVPAAIIEIISPHYETKDLEELPPVYLANGIADILVIDADQRQATHFRSSGTTRFPIPATIDFECGCCCTVHG
ncbi:MAG: Uma2 family endonuclease [Chloroflexaceae bacterium]|nr:Uma2 family endonuclease [Chloroflexaceae bacterium]